MCVSGVVWSVITVGKRCNHLRKSFIRQCRCDFSVGTRLAVESGELRWNTALKLFRLGVTHCLVVMPGHYGAGGKKKPNGKKKGMKKGSKKMRCSCGK